MTAFFRLEFESLPLMVATKADYHIKWVLQSKFSSGLMWFMHSMGVLWQG